MTVQKFRKGPSLLQNLDPTPLDTFLLRNTKVLDGNWGTNKNTIKQNAVILKMQ